MEECWQVRALHKSHPFVIQILQIIYLIGQDSCKTPHILTGTVAEFFFPFFPVGEEIKEDLKIHSSLCVCLGRGAARMRADVHIICTECRIDA